jgi:hypothetical protein
VFDNLKQVPAAATVEFIDFTHANPRATWIANGQPKYCSADEIAAELKASELVEESIDLVYIGAGSSSGSAISAKLTLEPFSVARIKFEY